MKRIAPAQSMRQQQLQQVKRVLVQKPIKTPFHFSENILKKIDHLEKNGTPCSMFREGQKITISKELLKKLYFETYIRLVRRKYIDPSNVPLSTEDLKSMLDEAWTFYIDGTDSYKNYYVNEYKICKEDNKCQKSLYSCIVITPCDSKVYFFKDICRGNFVFLVDESRMSNEEKEEDDKQFELYCDSFFNFGKNTMETDVYSLAKNIESAREEEIELLSFVKELENQDSNESEIDCLLDDIDSDPVPETQESFKKQRSLIIDYDTGLDLFFVI